MTVFDVAGRGDATPSIAAAGTFVAVAWGSTADGKADVMVATSRDGGATFGSPVRVNHILGEGRLGGELPPRVALHQGPAGVPVVTVLWTARGDVTEIKVSRSRDGGVTFEAPLALQTAGATGDRGWPALTVDGRGVAHAIWLDHRGLAARRAQSGAPAATGGKPHVHARAPGVDGAVMAQGSALYFASADQPVARERAITTGVCYCCKTALAAGADGTLFAAWRHVYPGDLRDMAMSISRDGGRSFSTPARVSEDGWAINGCPDDGPAVAVDSNGTAHIVWPTVIPGDEPEGALFYATTRDGMRFSPRVRVPTLGSPKPMHPQLIVRDDGTLVVGWDELLDGARVAAVRTITPANDAAPRFGDAVRLTASRGCTSPGAGGDGRGVVAAGPPGARSHAWSSGP